jgi:L-asparaginase
LREVADLRVRSPFRIDSSSITPEHWQKLAEIVADELPRVDGVVISHGTDTLAYTAAALSFMLPGLRKPVVLTGAMRPLSSIRNDASSNLVDAVEVATRGLPEVVICFGGLVLRGNRARKRSLSDYRAFESPNCASLGEVGASLRLYPERFWSPEGRLRLITDLDPRVAHLRLSPGVTGSTLKGLEASEVAGIVLEAFGAGNMPLADGTLVPELHLLREHGLTVVVVSGCEQGAVDLGLYAGGRAARDAGCISGGDMTGEAAVVKLMVALGRFSDPKQVRRFMLRSIAGERS